MYSLSMLSHGEAVSALELFEQGFTAKCVAASLGLAKAPVHVLYQRWQYDFETKLAIVRRYISGGSARALCEEFDLSSPSPVAHGVSIYRRDGEDVLCPKRRGRPPAMSQEPRAESETEAMGRENERLRAEVAYLGILRALTSP